MSGCLRLRYQMATTMDVGQRIPTNSERSNPLSSPNQSTKEDHPTNNSIHPSANCINENLRFFFFLFFFPSFFLWRFLSYHGEHVVKQHDGPVNKVERRRTSSPWLDFERNMARAKTSQLVMIGTHTIGVRQVFISKQYLVVFGKHC